MVNRMRFIPLFLSLIVRWVCEVLSLLEPACVEAGLDARIFTVTVGERYGSRGDSKARTFTEKVGASSADSQDPRNRGHLVRMFKKELLPGRQIKPTPDYAASIWRRAGEDKQSFTANVSGSSLAKMQPGGITPPEPYKQVEREAEKGS
jgi:hypothetical protein